MRFIQELLLHETLLLSSYWLILITVLLRECVFMPKGKTYSSFDMSTPDILPPGLNLEPDTKALPLSWCSCQIIAGECTAKKNPKSLHIITAISKCRQTPITSPLNCIAANDNSTTLHRGPVLTQRPQLTAGKRQLLAHKPKSKH